MSKQQVRLKKGNITDYNKDKMQGMIYFAEDKKKIIVDGIEYGLDLESDDVNLISNIEYKDNKLTIIFSNGKTKEIELEAHRVSWEEIELPSLEKSFPMGGCVISTHPIKKFSFQGGSGKWYSSDGQEGEYNNTDLTTITFKEEGEYTLKFVNNYMDGYNGLNYVPDNSVKGVLMIGGRNGKTEGISPVNKNENAKLIFYNNITSIGGMAFWNCSGFTSLKLPDSVTSIRNNAFYNCKRLSGELILPDSVTSIGSYAFNSCSEFTSLKLPESLTSIGSYAFAGCSGFTGELIIPENVTSIGDNAFAVCKGLSKIYVCEDTTLGDDWNIDTTAEVIKYKKGKTPWLDK